VVETRKSIKGGTSIIQSKEASTIKTIESKKTGNELKAKAAPLQRLLQNNKGISSAPMGNKLGNRFNAGGN
jgi:hypothetical protein